MQERVIIKVTGKVQGVFFRQFVKDFADKLRLKGTVKNLPSQIGVEIVVEGEHDDIRSLIKACQEGPKLAIIDHVDVVHEEPLGEFTSFRISF